MSRKKFVTTDDMLEVCRMALCAHVNTLNEKLHGGEVLTKQEADSLCDCTRTVLAIIASDRQGTEINRKSFGMPGVPDDHKKQLLRDALRTLGVQVPASASIAEMRQHALTKLPQ